MGCSSALRRLFFKIGQLSQAPLPFRATSQARELLRS